MADKVQRFSFVDGCAGCCDCGLEDMLDGDYVEHEDYAKLETELRDLKTLHADIIDQGRKVQIGASGESKYGAMSDSEFIEWALGKLEGK